MPHDPRCEAPSQDEVMASCREAVERVGWHCIGVLRGEDHPPFDYTTGLYKTHAHPELMIAGIDPELGYGAISAAVRLIEAGRRLTGPGDYDEVLEGYPVRFRDVELSTCRLSFGVSDIFYDGWQVRRLQMMWPDREGRFPGDPLCRPGVVEMQQIGPLS